jgi:hypothetical protein
MLAAGTAVVVIPALLKSAMYDWYSPDALETATDSF